MKKQQGFFVAVIPFGLIVFCFIAMMGWAGYAKLAASAAQEEYVETTMASELIRSYTSGKEMTKFPQELVSFYDEDDVKDIFTEFCEDKEAGSITSHFSEAPHKFAKAGDSYTLNCTLKSFTLSFYDVMMLLDGDRIEDFLDEYDIDMETVDKFVEPQVKVEPVVVEEPKPVPAPVQVTRMVETQAPVLDVSKTPITVGEIMELEEWFGSYLQERCDKAFFNGSTYEMMPGSSEVNVEFYEDSRDYYTLTCANPTFRHKKSGATEQQFQKRDFKLMRFTLRNLTQ